MTTQTKKNQINVTQLLLLIMATGILYYGLYDLHERLLFILMDVWSKVGVVMIALLPLTILLATVPIYLLLNQDKDRSGVIKILQVISFAGPSLGLLGTVLGTVEGTAAFSMAKGVEQLLNSVVELQKGLSIALLSTAWGTILSIPSGILLILLTKDDSASDNHSVINKKSSETDAMSETDETTPSVPSAEQQPVEQSSTKDIFKPQMAQYHKADKAFATQHENNSQIPTEEVINTLSSLGIKGVQTANKELS